MPRTRRPQAKPAPTALVSSAAKVLAGRRRNLPRGQINNWQNEAWAMLDTVGELEFYRGWLANALSRCTLSVVEVDADDNEIPVTGGLPAQALDSLFGGETGQAEMLSSMAGHLAIPGETWLCGLTTPPDDPDGPDMWRVLSKDEVKEEGQQWIIDRGDGEAERYAPDEVYITRIWRPHPRKWVEANSNVRSALPILRELVGLSKHVGASIDSRLAGAGILAIPTEMTFAAPPSAEDDPTDASLDPFLAALIDAMVTAMEDRGDVSAVAPLLIRGPGQYLDKIRHITFATPFDEKAQGLRAEAITRLANSLDVPAEVLTGMADVNHWTGWLLDENAIKMHVEPLLSVITSGLTTRYLWPVLQGDAQTFDPALRRYKIKGETSALRQRPNRSAEAIQMHDTLTITNKALVRETGFSDEDLLDPNTPEFKQRLLVQMTKKASDPAVAAAIMGALGIDAQVAIPAASAEADTGTGDVAPPPPATAPENARDVPQQQAAALMAASEPLVMRAVERAWNRAGKRGRTRLPVPSADLDAAMMGAWEGVSRAAALLGVDGEALYRVLDSYARSILTTGDRYDPMALSAALHPLVREPLAIGGR